MNIDDVKYLKNIKDLEKTFNIKGNLVSLSTNNFVVKDDMNVYKLVSDIKINFDKHVPYYMDNVEGSAEYIKKAIKEFEVLQKETGKDLSSFVLAFKEILKHMVSSRPITTFKKYLKDMESLSERSDYVNSFIIKGGFTKSPIVEEVWSQPEVLSQLEILKVKGMLDEFEKVSKDMNGYILWPSTIDNNITKEAKIVDNKCIMYRPNFPLLNKKIFIDKDLNTILIFPMFNKSIDEKIIDILNRNTIPNIKIQYSVASEMKNIFDF